jgi:excisionase family DNA binding protein
MFIKTPKAAKLLGINEKTFRVWVKKGLVPMRRIGTSQVMFNPKQLLEWWKAVENIPDTQELKIGRKAKAVQQIKKMLQQIELTEWRENRRQTKLKGMEQVVNG